jgi:hypothetical protein
MHMNNKWLSSGRYGITKGLRKRLWEKKPSLSVVMVPSIVYKKTPGPNNYEPILSESSEEIMTEDGIEILAESVMVE